mgnify:CR=1 FL=1
MERRIRRARIIYLRDGQEGDGFVLNDLGDTYEVFTVDSQPGFRLLYFSKETMTDSQSMAMLHIIPEPL